jgi:UDP-glucose 4-epimerase
MHFPHLYFQHNAGGTPSLLETMLDGVTRIVFSSCRTTYGRRKPVLITEEQVNGRKVPFQGLPRCPIADARKALRCLACLPRYSDLKRIVQAAWTWQTSIRYRDGNAMVQPADA